MKRKYFSTKLVASLSLTMILLSFLGTLTKSQHSDDSSKQNTEVVEKAK